MVKEYLATATTIAIYVVVSIYLIVQRLNGNLVYADAQLFVGLTVVFFLLGLLSFFNLKLYVSISGMILMLMTLIMTALFLFL